MACLGDSELQAVVDEAYKHIPSKATHATLSEVLHNTISDSDDRTAEIFHKTVPDPTHRTAEVLHDAISDSIDRTDIVEFLNVHNDTDPNEKDSYNMALRQWWKEGVEDSKNFQKQKAKLGVSGAACHIFVGVRPFSKDASQSFMTRLTMEWWQENEGKFLWRKLMVQAKGSTEQLDGSCVSVDGVTPFPDFTKFFLGRPHFSRRWQHDLETNVFVGVILTYRLGNVHSSHWCPDEQNCKQHQMFEERLMQPNLADSTRLEEIIWTAILAMPDIPDFFGLPVKCNGELISKWFESIQASSFSYLVRNKKRMGNLEACCCLVDVEDLSSRVIAAWRTKDNCYWEYLVARVRENIITVWTQGTFKAEAWSREHFKKVLCRAEHDIFEVEDRTMLVIQTHAIIHPSSRNSWELLQKAFPGL